MGLAVAHSLRRNKGGRGMTVSRKAQVWGAWIGLFIAFAAYYPRFAKDAVGMVLYPQAGECVLKGMPLHACAEFFSYPPAFAFLMSPFAARPLGLRIGVWYAVSVGATIGCFAISERLVRRLLPGVWCDKDLGWLRVASAILSLKFVLAVFEWQAYDTLAAFIVLLGLWALVGRRGAASGALLALAAAIKATPLVFLPYLVVKRRFLAVAVFVPALAVLSMLPDLYAWSQGMQPHYLQTWLKQIVAPAAVHGSGEGIPFWTAWMDANTLNHSFRGAVARLVVNTPAAAHAEAILYSVSAVYIAVIGLLLLRTARNKDFVAIDGSLLVISMLMLSPMTSRYHYILLVLPYMTVTGIALRVPALRAAAIVTLAVSFVLGTATSNDVAGKFLTDWSYDHDFLLLSALVLLAFLAYVIVRGEVAQAQPGLAPAHGAAT